MRIRAIKRQIAKARMNAMNVGNVNSVMSAKEWDLPYWKCALYGKTGEEAHMVHMNLGQLIKAKEQGRKSVKRRKLKKVTE